MSDTDPSSVGMKGAAEEPAPIPEAVPIAAAPVKFCGACGAAWEVGWVECGRCAPQTVGVGGGAIAAVAVGTTYEEDVRAVKSSVRLYFALLAVCLVGAVAGMISKRPLGMTADVVISGMLSLVIVGWCLVARAGILPLLRRAGRPGWYLVAVGAAVCTYLLASVIVRAVSEMAGAGQVEYLTPYEASGVDWRWAVLLVCVQPAIFEELAFRGFIQTSLGKVIGPYEAVVTQALMFGILHCSLPSMPHLCLLGVMLGTLRLWTGSLYPGMALHFTHNFLVILSEHYGRSWPWS